MTQLNNSQMKKTGKKRGGFWISLGLGLFVLIIYVLSRPEFGLIPFTGILEVIEAKTFDMRFWLRGTRHPGDDIVIVAVDEKTEDELGRWQSFGRQWLASLIDRLTAGGAKVIGLDLILSEPGEEDDDRQLANAIKRSDRVVVGVYHYFDTNSIAHLTPEQQQVTHQLMVRTRYFMIQVPTTTTNHALNLYHSFGVEAPLPLFADVANSFGHTNVTSHHDGYIRHVPLLIEYMDNYYPALSLEVARTYLNPLLSPIIHAWERGDKGSIDNIQIGNIRIPTDEYGRLLINYYGGKYTFPHYSMSDIILGRVIASTFHNKIVLVGFTSALAQDMHSTSFHTGVHPGVEIQATIIANILRNDFLTRPEAIILIDGVILLVISVIMGILLPRIGLITSVLIVLMSLFGIAALVHGAFLFQKIWLNVTFPIMLIILDYLTITLYKLHLLQKEHGH